MKILTDILVVVSGKLQCGVVRCNDGLGLRRPGLESQFGHGNLGRNC